MSRLIATGSAAGALAGKVSGAGGGGFMTFLVDPPHRADVIRALSKQTGQVLTCSFTTLGAESWRVGLGALTATTPKPLLPCGDRPFLSWVISEMLRFGLRDFLLLTGHMSAALRAAVPGLARRLPMAVRIDCAEVPLRAGTGGALYYVRRQLDERFLLCNGDSLLDANLTHLLAAAAGDPPKTIGRLALHRLNNAARFGVVELAAT
jgi:GHMP kinases C terminal/Nucleotidyl transferase